MTETFISWGMDADWAWGVATIAGILLIALPLMLSVAMIIYADRKIWAAIALRRGPNVVGPFGLLQSFADGLKVFLQETIIPTGANRGLFLIAPIITFTVALMAWAVIPFNSGAVLADINVGLLYILAISSLGVYGVILSGWASNSKYPFFSAMRASAQMISYEVSIGFILIGVVLYADSFNLNEIIKAQEGFGLGFVNAFGFNLLLFPLAVMFLISSLAETARAPFDLTEAESELVAGYQTEYSSMAFALFWLGEYANVLLMCTLNAVLFWGGWLPPLNIDLIPWFDIPGWVWLFGKILFFFFVFSWVKATVPRYRYDQLMRLGWKIFLPISLIWIFLISGWLMLTKHSVKAQSVPTEVSALYSFDCPPSAYKLDAGGDLGGSRYWLITGPDAVAVRAKTVGTEVGLPGAEHLQWTNSAGTVVSGEIRENDNIGPHGPDFALFKVGDPSGESPVYDCRPVEPRMIGKPA